MKLDHIVLTVKSIEKTILFYKDVLGIKAFPFGNLLEISNEIPKAA